MGEYFWERMKIRSKLQLSNLALVLRSERGHSKHGKSDFKKGAFSWLKKTHSGRNIKIRAQLKILTEREIG